MIARPQAGSGLILASGTTNFPLGGRGLARWLWEGYELLSTNGGYRHNRRKPERTVYIFGIYLHSHKRTGARLRMDGEISGKSFEPSKP